jgi:hypothetical protein
VCNWVRCCVEALVGLALVVVFLVLLRCGVDGAGWCVRCRGFIVRNMAGAVVGCAGRVGCCCARGRVLRCCAGVSLGVLNALVQVRLYGLCVSAREVLACWCLLVRLSLLACCAFLGSFGAERGRGAGVLAMVAFLARLCVSALCGSCAWRVVALLRVAC